MPEPATVTRNKDFAINSAPAKWPWWPWAARSAPGSCWARPRHRARRPRRHSQLPAGRLHQLDGRLALGELACAHPAAGSFGVYGDLYLNDWAGFLSRGGILGRHRSLDRRRDGGRRDLHGALVPERRRHRLGCGFFARSCLVNFLSVGAYGRFEFWFAMIKVVTIAAFMVLGAALLLTGRARRSTRRTADSFPLGMLAPLLAMTFAIYTFGGDRVRRRHVGRIALAE